MLQVLHIAAHLGGGVGKALSGLVGQSNLFGSRVRHTIVVLEKPEKHQYCEQIRQSGGEVSVCPSAGELADLVEAADVVQLEWWNHPATLRCLCQQPLPAMRLLVWCHVSGLHTPIIPPRLPGVSQRFLFTSPCSYQGLDRLGLPDGIRERLGVVFSSGGFDGLPRPSQYETNPLAVGYIGSLNFAKLHPCYIDFLAAVRMPDFTVRLIGDALNLEALQQRCEKAGKPGLLEFRGYTTDIAGELQSINTLAYLLNPSHYGTTENGLLEAMAVGIVPIVLDNPAEKCIVEDGRTGLVVTSPAEFADAVELLHQNPRQRNRLGRQAAESVRTRFTANRMESSLKAHYHEILRLEKMAIEFDTVFGAEPADWFLASQEEPDWFLEERWSERHAIARRHYALFETTKGSVFHFRRYFPDDSRLARWAAQIDRLSRLPEAES
ncbi:MAG: glycosyltransferase [Thermoguttaceae bacterium]|jgi:glycosyltransferase involved in cell wall biosynthesis|nr:glycosyltransferase [Thermoguttaceae bacterium]